MHYDERANGHEVEAKLNDELEISLSETRTSGYRWVTKSAGEPALKLLEETAQPHTSGVGGSGQHVWKFRAIAGGTGEVQLHYFRPWENSAEPARTFVLKVRVRS